MWITKLTPEQEALLSICRDKWIKIAFSIQAIDRSKASYIVKRLYNLMSFQEPEVYFARSPYEALRRFIIQIQFPSEEQSNSLSLEYFVQKIEEIYGNILCLEIGN